MIACYHQPEKYTAKERIMKRTKLKGSLAK